MMKVIGWGLLAALALFCLLVVIGSMDQRTPAERIADACRDQYGVDQSAVTDCRLRHEVRFMADRERQRDDRVSSEAGQ